MAQTFTALDGDEIALSMDETIEKLRKALPKDHPVVKEVAEIFEVSGANLEELSEAIHGEIGIRNGAMASFIEEDHDAFVNILEDWRRGIRDWDEVEQALKDVRYFRENLDGVKRDANVTSDAARRGRRPR